MSAVETLTGKLAAGMTEAEFRAWLDSLSPAEAREVWRHTCGQLTGADGAVWIYAVQAGVDGPVKIGRTRNVRERLADLQSANGEELRLIAAWRGVPKTEQELHAEYADLRLRGEWFVATPELLRDMRALDCYEGVR